MLMDNNNMDDNTMLDGTATIKVIGVFTAVNSTPLIPESTILFTALFPAPPTPITLMVAVPSSRCV